MQQLSAQDRERFLREMSARSLDVLVIGGGITGAGVALDAAARGYKVGLVEKSDFASGTSSKSTKLVHGGLRYLPEFDFALVREALAERSLLLANAPFLVRPIGFVLPLYKETHRPLGTPVVPPLGIGMTQLVDSALLLYDLMAGRLNVRRHRRLSTQDTLRTAAILKAGGLQDSFVYYDAQTDDSLLTTTVMRTAVAHGAAVANYVEVTGFETEGDRIAAAKAIDRLSGEPVVIPAKTIINACGVFAGRLESLAGGLSSTRITPAKGVHITVSREALPVSRTAVVLPETDDGRLLFIVPWGSRVIVGTTDTEGGDIDRPQASPADIDYLVRHVNRYVAAGISKEDIVSSWAGYRPLVSTPGNSKLSSRLSRTHAVIDGPGGMLTIVGGKLTTYRRMAEDVIDHMSRIRGEPVRHVTAHLPLFGSDHWLQAASAVKSAAGTYSLSADTVDHLGCYGSSALHVLRLLESDAGLSSRILPELPYIMAEVVFSCRFTMAVTLADVLMRRLHVSTEDWDHGLGIAPQVAECMAGELGWDETECRRQVEDYHRSLAMEGLVMSEAAAKSQDGQQT